MYTRIMQRVCIIMLSEPIPGDRTGDVLIRHEVEKSTKFELENLMLDGNLIV